MIYAWENSLGFAEDATELADSAACSASDSIFSGAATRLCPMLVKHKAAIVVAAITPPIRRIVISFPTVTKREFQTTRQWPDSGTAVQLAFMCELERFGAALV